MSIIPSRLRPFLILIILLLTALTLLTRRPAIEPQASALIETATKRPISTNTPTPTNSPPPPDTTTPTQTPVPQSSLTPEPTPTATPTPKRIQEHIVQAGESIDTIALRYNITAASIIGLNYLDQPDLLLPGQTLQIPRYPNPTPDPAAIATAIQEALARSSPGPAVLGYSVLERPIDLYTFGDGPNTLILIGGLHGGYEWNATVLAYRFIDYFQQTPTAVPDTVTLHIIPAANPDGLFAVTGKTGPIVTADILLPDSFQARFNANNVDLNRNWDCDWSPTAVWWDETISGGTGPYSEVENQVLLAFINSQRQNLRGVIFWHSSAFLVSPGQCGDQPHQPSQAIANTFATAARYPLGAFDAYPITGESTNALAQMGIPAFSVELSSHQDLDWTRNLAGLRALLSLYPPESHDND